MRPAAPTSRTGQGSSPRNHSARIGGALTVRVPMATITPMIATSSMVPISPVRAGPRAAERCAHLDRHQVPAGEHQVFAPQREP